MAGRDTPTWALVPMAGVGAVLAVVGIALARDYRGFVTWHSEKTAATFWPLQQRLRCIPPWRWLPAQTREQVVRRQQATNRIFGISLALAGLFIAAVCLIVLLVRLT